MPWWLGVVLNGVFFPVLWIVSIAAFPTAKPWILQLSILPAVYGMNLWYALSVAKATTGNVPFVFVMMLQIVTSATVSFLLGRFVLGQQMEILQIVGMVLAVGGVVLMQVR